MISVSSSTSSDATLEQIRTRNIHGKGKHLLVDERITVLGCPVKLSLIFFGSFTQQINPDSENKHEI